VGDLPIPIRAVSWAILHRPRFRVDIHLVGPPVLQFDDLGLNIRRQRFDFLGGIQKCVEIRLLAAGADGSTDLLETEGEANAEVGPGLAAGTLEDRSDLDGSLAKIILPGGAGNVAQAVDITAGDGAHSDDGSIANLDQIPQFVGGESLQRVEIKNVPVNDVGAETGAKRFQRSLGSPGENLNHESANQTFFLDPAKFIITFSVGAELLRNFPAKANLPEIDVVDIQRLNILFYDLARLVDAGRADLDDRLWHMGAIFVKRDPQYLKRIAVIVAGMKPDTGVHRQACDLDAFLERDFVIAEPGGAVDVFGKIVQAIGAVGSR
jgi:hypothetical protein